MEIIKRKWHESKLQISILGVLIIVFAAFAIANPRVFLNYSIYYSFMSTIPFAAILAISLTMVIILGEIDLSFPSVMGFCAWVFSALFKPGFYLQPCCRCYCRLYQQCFYSEDRHTLTNCNHRYDVSVEGPYHYSL